MKKIKIIVALTTFVALTLSLAACMNTAQEPAVTAAPSADATGMATFMPDGTPAPTDALNQTGLNAAFDWRSNAPQIEERIDQISEISESRVVVTGSTALVGVKFASAYKGELTERIREMVAGVVREADPSIQTVTVTAEAGDVDAVYGFADQIQTGKNGDDLAEDINRIVRNITTLR